jgi:hypothetical protein
LATCTALSGADREFDQIVKGIERQYGVKPNHIPLLGVGNLLLKTTHPQGVSGFRIAVFEDLAGAEGFFAVMNGVGDSNLHPVVQVQSRFNRESTYVFAGSPGKSTRLLVATLENGQATVIEVKADLNALLQLLRDPDHIGDALAPHPQDP